MFDSAAIKPEPRLLRRVAARLAHGKSKQNGECVSMWTDIHLHLFYDAAYVSSRPELKYGWKKAIR